MKTGWIWKPLGEVCKTGSGGTPLSSRKEYYEDGSIPWLLSGEVAQGNVREAKNFITKEGLENSAARLFPKDTVLVAMYGATAGQVGILRFEAATNQAICGILPNGNFVPEFLLYFLMAKRDQLVAQATGNAQPNISQIKVKNTIVPIPPLSEQQRIVGLLDEAFEAIATAKASAEQNLQNARALFESHLQSVFTERGEGWEEKPLGELCVVLDNQRKPITKRDRVAGDIPYYGATCIQDYVRDFIFDEPLVLVGEDGAKWKSGDKTAFAVSGKCWVNNHAHVLRPHRDKLTDYWLISFLCNSDLTPFVSGLTVPKLNQGSLREIPIPLPPISIQRQLAETAESLEEKTQRLARLYEQKLAALEELKKSLLHQAFAGEL
jgi:restriction endonuclease S subunit